MSRDPGKSHREIHILVTQTTHLPETQGSGELGSEVHIMKDRQTTVGPLRSARSRKVF